MTDYNRDEAVYVPRQKYAPKFTVKEVRAFREEHECGLMDAKKELMRRQILEDLNRGRNSHDTVLLYDILEYIVENRYV